MKIISLKCNSCGSDLEVNEKTKYFNCSFCGSSLALQRSGNAVYTEVLDEIKGNTETILDTTEQLLIEKQIARLDRDWEKEEDKYQDLFSDEVKNNSAAPVAGVVFIIVAIGFFFGINNNSRTPQFLNIIPVIIIIVGVFTIVSGIIKSVDIGEREKSYENKKKKYQTSRQNLIQKIEELDT